MRFRSSRQLVFQLRHVAARIHIEQTTRDTVDNRPSGRLRFSFIKLLGVKIFSSQTFFGVKMPPEDHIFLGQKNKFRTIKSLRVKIFSKNPKTFKNYYHRVYYHFWGLKYPTGIRENWIFKYSELMPNHWCHIIQSNNLMRGYRYVRHARTDRQAWINTALIG